MITVFKYPLQLRDLQKVKVPKGANVLTVQVQDDGVCMWALVDTQEPESETVEIVICGTGNPLPKVSQMVYINTFQLGGGALVFHAFKAV